LNYIYSVNVGDIYFSNLSFSDSGVVLLKGQSSDPKKVFDYLKILERCGYFKKCSLGSLNIKTVEGQVQVRFDITCSI